MQNEGNDSMNRRDFLKRSALAAAGTAVAASSASVVAFAAGEASAGIFSDAERATLIKMARQIYPHDKLDDSYYAKVVDVLAADATKDPDEAKLLKDGVANLNQVAGGDFAAQSSDKQVEALKKIETTSFFQKVRSTETVALYNNPEVWKVFGYPGPSYPIGGYIHHGFNDLKWLPDPPESASPKPA
jgi:hypothetical protein